MQLFLLTFIPAVWRVSLVALFATALVALLMLASLGTALAQDAATSTSINVTPLVETGFWALSAIIVPVFTWIAMTLAKLMGSNRAIADEAMNRMLHAGIQRGIDWVEGHAREWLYKDGKPITFDVGSEAVATVTNRMIELSPDLIKRIGIDEDTLQRIVAEALTGRAGQTALLMETGTIEPGFHAQAANDPAR